MSDDDDVRQLAADRLAYVAALQLRQQRRGGAAPWADARQGQGRVLALLKIKPEITQRELTFLMGMSRQSLAELLGKLERQGLIEREPSTTDRRVVVVRLTQAGEEAEQGGHAGLGMDSILDCLDDDEAARFADYLGRVIERLEQEFGDDADERRQQIWAFLRDGDPRRFGQIPGYVAGIPGYMGADPRLVGDPRLAGRDPRSRGFDPGPRGRRGRGPFAGPVPPEPPFGPPVPPPFGPVPPEPFGPVPPEPPFGPPVPPEPFGAGMPPFGMAPPVDDFDGPFDARG